MATPTGHSSAATVGRDGQASNREVREILTGRPTLLFVYSEDDFAIENENPTIRLLPLRGSVTSRQFFSKFLEHGKGVTVVCILRSRLCTDFLARNVERIYNTFSVRLVVCYDRPAQMFNQDISLLRFHGLTVSRMPIQYQETRIFGGLYCSTYRKNERIAPMFSAADFVRDKLDDYPPNHPSWLIALDILKDSSLNLQPYMLARAIRDVRRQEGMMAGLPMLYELVDWVIATSNWNLSEDPECVLLEAMCSQHVPEGGYFNLHNLRKTVDYIQSRRTQVAH